MAKRKRLSLPNPGFLDAALEAPAAGMFARPAPIADVAREASSVAALDEMAETLTRARAEGRMVLSLSLDEIELDYLVRDRTRVDEAEMAALTESLRARGQQTPIELEDLGEGRAKPRYGLISGWRRCQALCHLAQETGEARFGEVLALLRQPEQSSNAYLAMVEENEVRVGLSYYERARIVSKAVEHRVYSSPKEALRALFASASRTKRSKIGGFLTIVDQLEGALQFPEAMGERSGLALSKALQKDAGLARRLKSTLKKAAPEDAQAEQALIGKTLKQSLTRSDRPKKDKGEELAPGVWLRAQANGDLVISGKTLPEGLQDELRQWLRDQL